MGDSGGTLTPLAGLWRRGRAWGGPEAGRRKGWRRPRGIARRGARCTTGTARAKTGAAAEASSLQGPRVGAQRLAQRCIPRDVRAGPRAGPRVGRAAAATPAGPVFDKSLTRRPRRRSGNLMRIFQPRGTQGNNPKSNCKVGVAALSVEGGSGPCKLAPASRRRAPSFGLLTRPAKCGGLPAPALARRSPQPAYNHAVPETGRKSRGKAKALPPPRAIRRVAGAGRGGRPRGSGAGHGEAEGAAVMRHSHGTREARAATAAPCCRCPPGGGAQTGPNEGSHGTAHTRTHTPRSPLPRRARLPFEHD